jgi:uncharacterized FAD-dependent dehydrogenase
MCPGGIIAPAATDANEIVVNGWSPSKRNNPFANSGLVASVDSQDFFKYDSSPLSALKYQESVERKSFLAGGGSLKAPAQRLVDFVNGKISDDLPLNSYVPGLHSASLQEVLPVKLQMQSGQHLKSSVGK